MAANNLQLLSDAIARNAGVVLSLPSAGMLRHHKSRFLAEVPGGFWVEASPRKAPLVDSLILSQQPAGVSFKAGALKVVFPAVLLQRDPAYRINALVEVGAVLLAMPADVQVIQRRNNYRVRILPERRAHRPHLAHRGAGLSRDRPMHAQEVGVRPARPEPRRHGRHVPRQRRRAAERRHPGSPPHRAVARREQASARGPHAPPVQTPKEGDGPRRRAVPRLQDDLDGRQILAQLTRILGEFQREEVRRLRVSL